MNYRIKEILKEKNISASEFAEKIGVTRETLSRIINGGNTSSETLSRIADELNVHITSLFEQPAALGEMKCPNCGVKLELKQKV